MPAVHPSSKHAGLKHMAQAQNSVDAVLTQQQGGIQAPVPGATLVGVHAAQPNQVQTTGLLTGTPAGTPGGDAPAYGERWFDANGTIRMQIDQYGFHLYNAGGAYTGELVAY